MRKYVSYFWICGIVLYLCSCIETKVFIQQVDVEGPIIQPMVKITDNKRSDEIETSFRVMFNSRENIDINISGHTFVNAAGEYQVEAVPSEDYYRENDGVNIYQFEGNNTSWNLPEFQFGMNIDFPLSNYTAICLGADYSNINSNSYWNGNIGLGFFKEFEKSAIRFDGIINLTHIKSDLEYVVTRQNSGNNYKDVYFYNDERSDTHTDFKFMFTFNTKKLNFPVDLFFNFSAGSQQLYLKELTIFEETEEISLTNNAVNFAAGVYHYITPSTRLVLGTNITNLTQRNDRALAYPVYFLQLDSYLFSGD